MNRAKLNRYRALLHERLSVLEGNGIGEEVASLEVPPSEQPDPTDQASFETDRNFELRLRDRDRKLVEKIKEALQRIEEGTYGVCEECGQPIGEKRLAARPVTTYCIECKEDAERRERRAVEPPLTVAAPIARRAVRRAR
jgi:DnaK suppressor protein